MKTTGARIGWALAVAGLAAAPAWAQLGKPTSEELMRRGNGPGPAAGGQGAVTGAAVVADAAPVSTDPRDFSGYWRSAGGPGGGGRPGGAPGGVPGGAPGGAPGGPGGGPTGAGGPGGPGGNFNPDGNVPKGAGRLPDRILCLPQSGTQVGVDGPLRLVQTPEQITWASEEMHTIRRIFLAGEFSNGFKPNYYGEAIGHWDGNTLVVETVGMKSLPAGAKMVERWTKGADGRTLKIEMGNVDASGKALGVMRTQNLSYRTGEQVYEWMCEDYNDEWLPGGADYDDQVGKKQ